MYGIIVGGHIGRSMPQQLGSREKTALHFTFPFSLYLVWGFSPWDGAPTFRVKWVFLTQLNYSRNSPTDIPKSSVS